MYKLNCSQCKRRFQGQDKGDVLSRMRKHQQKEHKDWLSRRIKRGIKKHHNNPGGNPGIKSKIGKAIAGGIFPPVALGHAVQDYQKMNPQQRNVVKTTVNLAGKALGPEGQAVALATIFMLERFAGEAPEEFYYGD